MKKTASLNLTKKNSKASVNAKANSTSTTKKFSNVNKNKTNVLAKQLKKHNKPNSIAIEQRIQAIIDNLAGNHWWKDREGHYLGCSTTIARTLGFDSPKEVIGKTDYELPWADKADYLVRNDQEVMLSGQAYKNEEVLITKEGERLTFLVTKMPLRDENNNIIGTIGTSTDITEMKQLQQRLEEAKQRAELSDKLKTEFIRNMEHDIRTPFSGIYTIASHLTQQEEDPQKKEYLGAIAASAKELLDYCNGIIDYSRIEMKLLSVMDKKFNLEKLVRGVIVLEKIAAKQKNLAIDFAISDNVPKILIGDSYRLRRILINLISNAIKFTHEGHIKLSISVVAQRGKEVLVRFAVLDTGIGIPEDKIDSIYERFSRLTPSNQGLYKGTGLGLKIVKEFVKEMEGEIDVQSQLGKGTQFYCTLPLVLPLTNDFIEDT